MQRAVAGTLNAVCVLVFVGIGRSSHTEGLTAAGVARTSWPFLAGAAVGWVVVRAWRRPVAIVPTGIVVWLACVAVGMALRMASGQGTASTFVLVALVFVGIEILGWRALAGLAPPFRGSPPTEGARPTASDGSPRTAVGGKP